MVEFKITKTSKLMDISKLQIGAPIRIKTEDEIYDSYISAITIEDENYIYFKTGNLRLTLLDKLKKENSNTGNKLDVSGGTINGNININGKIYNDGEELSLKDSGWKTATLTNSFKEYNDNTYNTPQYRKVGNTVEIRGVVTPKSNIASGNATTIFTLPTGYRPPKTRYAICQGTGLNRWLLSIESNGTVTVSRYGTTSDSTISAGNWLPFSYTFLVD